MEPEIHLQQLGKSPGCLGLAKQNTENRFFFCRKDQAVSQLKTLCLTAELQSTFITQLLVTYYAVASTIFKHIYHRYTITIRTCSCFYTYTRCVQIVALQIHSSASVLPRIPLPGLIRNRGAHTEAAFIGDVKGWVQHFPPSLFSSRRTACSEPEKGR